MKILHTFAYYHPSIGGSQEVLKQISERLVRRGHRVTVATAKLPNRTASSVNGVRIEPFSISGNQVCGIRGEAKRYKEFLLSGDFDVMMNYGAQQWATDLAFPILDRIPCAKVLAPCGFSGLHRASYSGYFQGLPKFLRRYDRLVFHSGTYQDVQFARRHGLTDFTVIPNGASAAEFADVDATFRRRYAIPDDVPLLLSVGSHTRLKGHATTIEAFRQARIGRSVLVIIGNRFGRIGCRWSCRLRAAVTRAVSFGRKRVLLANPPRRDVVAAFHAADLFVFPSNVECSPIVLYEAMASGTPFVATVCGNSAEIAQRGGGIVVPTRMRADGFVEADPRQLAREIEQLVLDPQRRRTMATAGHQAWKQRFTWEKIAKEYETLYENVVGARAALANSA